MLLLLHILLLFLKEFIKSLRPDMCADIEKRVLREVTSQARQFVWALKKPAEPSYVFIVDGVELKYKAEKKGKGKAKEEKKSKDNEEEEEDDDEEEEEAEESSAATISIASSMSISSSKTDASVNHASMASNFVTPLATNNDLSRPFTQFSSAANIASQFSNLYQQNFAQSYGSSNSYLYQPQQIGSMLENQSSIFPNSYCFNSDFSTSNNKANSIQEVIESDEEQTRDYF